MVSCGGEVVGGVDAGKNDATPTPPASTTTPPPDAGPPTYFDAGGRTCPTVCTSGHECCQNGCGGVPVSMPNGCCTCLPSEAISTSCPNDRCGG